MPKLVGKIAKDLYEIFFLKKFAVDALHSRIAKETLQTQIVFNHWRTNLIPYWITSSK